MKTKTIELYEFKELEEDVQEKVLGELRHINVDDSWWYDSEVDYQKDSLAKMGYIDADISFSGFGSQGDGASFTCKRVDLPLFLKHLKIKSRFKTLLPLYETGDISASVKRIHHRYSHEYTVRGEVLLDWNRETDKLMCLRDELESLLTEHVRTLSKQIFRDLESEYDSLTSDEAVIDTIEANEYTFRIDGEMENV